MSWRRGVGREFAGDQAGAAAKGEIEEAPLDEDDDAALEFDDVDQVDEEPDAPGNEARDMYCRKRWRRRRRDR